MSSEQNKLLSQQLLAALEANDRVTLDALVAPDYVQHGAGGSSDREALFQFQAAFHTAFPDGQFRIDDLIAEGEKVVVRWTRQGTHTGPWMQMPPTRKHVEFGGMDVWRWADGRLVEAWFLADSLTLLTQLGILPPMQPRSSSRGG